MDLDASHPIDEKGNFRERRRDLGGETLIYVILVYPVPDFACPGTHTGMQASAPEHLGLGTIKYAIDEVLAEIKLATAAAQMLTGKTLNAETADAAGKAAVTGATPLSQNSYKVQLARVAVKRALMGAAGAKG